MGIPRVTNSDCRSYVERREEFNGAYNKFSDNGHSVSGRRVGPLYVVLSYGYWPMLVYDERLGQWFSNSETYSRTTSKQHGQACPYRYKVTHVPKEVLDILIKAATLYEADAQKQHEAITAALAAQEST